MHRQTGTVTKEREELPPRPRTTEQRVLRVVRPGTGVQKRSRSAVLFAAQLLVYSVFLIAYLLFFVHFMHGQFATFHSHHPTGYAVLSLGLIVAQGIGLELLTTQMLRKLSAILR